VKCAHCPVAEGPCLGERAPRLCELAGTRPDYRRLLIEQARRIAEAGGRAPTLDDLLGAVATCPYRGGVLPHRLQAECGCGELSHCRAGCGAIPGRVTLRDCLACVAARSTAKARREDVLCE
jgi:hypothetical protein